jgi:uncharacterized protein (DUF2062 family)
LHRAAGLWQLAKTEHASPAQIAGAVALGSAASVAPFLFGLHFWVTLALATLFRVNRLWAACASQGPSLFGLLRAPIVFAEVELGSRLLTGGWLDLDLRDIAAAARRLALFWGVGGAVFSLVVALVLGPAAYVWARRRVIPRTPDGPHPASSESPPSAPPEPTR